MIACALTGPMPGSASSSSFVAVLMLVAASAKLVASNSTNPSSRRFMWISGRGANTSGAGRALAPCRCDSCRPITRCACGTLTYRAAPASNRGRAPPETTADQEVAGGAHHPPTGPPLLDRLGVGPRGHGLPLRIRPGSGLGRRRRERQFGLQLLEAPGANALDVLQFLDRLEPAVLDAVVNDRLGLGGSDARQRDEFLLAGGV